MKEKKLKKEEEMSFWEHLDALRSTLFKSIIAIVLMAIVAFFFKTFLMEVVIFGPKEPTFITNELFCQLGRFVLGNDKLCINQIDINMINLEMAGQFRLHILITMIAGIIIAMPYLLIQFWNFIKPALTSKEQRGSSGFVIVTNFLFLLGVSFGYFLIVPLALNFLTTYELSSNLENQFRIGSYIKMIVSISLSTGLVFELPVVIYFLAKVGIVDKALLKKYRKHAILVFFVLSAIITPPDIFSQFLVALPLMGLYEISIGIAGRVAKKRIPEL